MLADGKTAAISVYGKTAEPGRQVLLIDAATGKTLSTVDLGEKSRPHGLDALKDGRLLVTAEGTRELALVDPKTAKVVADSDQPRRVAHGRSVAGRQARVGHLDHGRKRDGDRPRRGKDRHGHPDREGRRGRRRHARRTGGLGREPEREHVVGHRRQVAQGGRDDRGRRVSDPRQVHAGRPDGVVAFTGSGDVGVFDRGKRTLVKRIPLGRNAVAGSESRVFQKTFGTSPAPVGILISPDGRHAWVAASHADVVSVINLDELKVDDAWPAGKEPDGLAGRKASDGPSPRTCRGGRQTPGRGGPPPQTCMPSEPAARPADSMPHQYGASISTSTVSTLPLRWTCSHPLYAPGVGSRTRNGIRRSRRRRARDRRDAHARTTSRRG